MRMLRIIDGFHQSAFIDVFTTVTNVRWFESNYTDFRNEIRTMFITLLAQFAMIVMISAINSISGEIYEAAQVDGAGEWAQLWNITLPAVWEQLRFVIVQIIIGTLGNYSLAMILANGGVNGSGMVMGLYVYQYGLSSATPKVGYANAAAVLLMIISSSLVLITNRLLNKEEV